MELGTYRTALEAAVAYARYMESPEAFERQADREKQARLCEAAARNGAVSEAQGFKLDLSETAATGYKGVYVKRGHAKSYEAYVACGGSRMSLAPGP